MNWQKGLVVLVLVILVVLACILKQERSRSLDDFNRVIKVRDSSFESGLGHRPYSADISWTGNLTGAQQADLLRGMWRGANRDAVNFPPTRETSPGTYLTPAGPHDGGGVDTGGAYTLEVSGCPAGLSATNISALDSPQTPPRKIHILLHRLSPEPRNREKT